ncbi:hypothetical protein ILUMI_07579 [Ignelater luminosus]|uniref:Mos1 transposase HTH domain-containing protein n=1 Tax=Ignelater luminosus TaxID=2038154 RepID=A0A8K0D807_IGNLU|nr:hypothetical protein ILUMI_07579 [Ignelater luminosus]
MMKLNVEVRVIDHEDTDDVNFQSRENKVVFTVSTAHHGFPTTRKHFCFKLQKSAKEAHEMLKAMYGDNLKTIYKWYERFKSKNVSVEDEQRSERPSTSKTCEQLQKWFVQTGD